MFVVVPFVLSQEKVSDDLLEALDVSSLANCAKRSAEPLLAMLLHGPALNETELIGTTKCVLDNVVCSRLQKDSMIMGILGHMAKHNLHHKHDRVLQDSLSNSIEHVLAQF